jgi:hypothetical protein
MTTRHDDFRSPSDERHPSPVISSVVLQYPATWRTVEDEELPLLDSALAERAHGQERQEALTRMGDMIAWRLQRRRSAFAATAAKLKRAGLDPSAPDANETLAVALAQKRALDIDRRRGPWPAIPRTARAWLSLLGIERRSHDLVAELVVHRLGVITLDRLQGIVNGRRQPNHRETPGAFEPSLFAGVGSLFAGFNTAYLIPEQTCHAEALSACAWLGWRMEKRAAPLPAPARTCITALASASPCEPDPAAVPDIQAVIRFGMGVAGVNGKNLDRHAQAGWPTPSDRFDLQPAREASGLFGLRLINAFGDLASPAGRPHPFLH